MNDPLPPSNDRPSGEPPSEQPPNQDAWNARSERREQRTTAREERRRARAESQSSLPWLGGAILILLGVVFLAQNLNLIDLGRWNWWAVFILIPAIGALWSAWTSYQAAGAWDSRARGSLIGGLILTLVAVAFLFNLDWGMIWPLFLIIAGLGALFSAVVR